MKNTTLWRPWVAFGAAWVMSAAQPMGAVIVADTATNLTDSARSATLRSTRHLKLRLSWGHKSPTLRPYRIALETNNAVITQLVSADSEPGETLKGGVCEGRAGAGDVDAVAADVSWVARTQPAQAAFDLAASARPRRARPGRAAQG